MSDSSPGPADGESLSVDPSVLTGETQAPVDPLVSTGETHLVESVPAWAERTDILPPGDVAEPLYSRN